MVHSFLFFYFEDDTRCLKLSLSLYVVDKDTGWESSFGRDHHRVMDYFSDYILLLKSRR